jgi:hypothetical protein
MDKKKIFIGLGIIAVIGGVYYFYNKSKNAQTGNTGGDTTGGDTTGGENKSADTVAPVPEAETPTAPTKAPLESKKDKRKACGIEPKKITGLLTGGVAMINFKKRKAKWQQCVDAGGKSGFEGDFDEFEESYMDFDNNFDISF